MGDAVVEQVAPAVVAFMGVRGPYSGVPAAFGTLYGWVARHGLTPSGMPRAAYMTDPAVVPEREAVWEVLTPVAGDPAEAPADETGCGIRHVGAHMEAVMVHVGPYESIAPTYRALALWTADNGYAIAGPPMEVYLSDPAQTAPADYVTEVRFPVTAIG